MQDCLQMKALQAILLSLQVTLSINMGMYTLQFILDKTTKQSEIL